MAGPTIEELLKAGGKPVEEAEPEPNMSYSPEAEKRAQKALEVPDVGEAETFFGHAASAIPLGNRTVDLIATWLNRDKGERARLTPQAREELIRMGEDVPPTAPEPSLLDDYRRIRDERAERQDVGAEQNPWSARLGTVTGIVDSLGLPLPGIKVAPAAKGSLLASKLGRVATSPAAARIASGTAAGAAYGALGGLTDGKADLTKLEALDALKDVGHGTLTGAAWGAGGGVVAEGARAAVPWLRKLSVRNAKEAGQGSSDIGAATRKPMRDESAAQILDDGKIRAFDNVQNIHDRVIPQANAEGEKLGRIIAGLEAAGYTGPNARLIAKQIADKGKALSPNLSSDKSPAKVYADEAAAIIDDVPEGQDFLGLSQAEKKKSSIQGRAKFEKLQSNEREDSLKDASRMLRLGIEDALKEQAAMRDADVRRAFRESPPAPEDLAALGDYANHNQNWVQEFIDQKAKTGKYLDFAQFAKKGQSKFDQRPRVGLHDTISAAAAAEGNPLKEKILAKINSEVRSRSASTAAVAADSARRTLQSGEAAENLGRAASEYGPQGQRDLAQWLDADHLEAVAKASPEELGEYADIISEAVGRGKDRLRAVDKVLRDTDPKWREIRSRLGQKWRPQ